MRDSYYTTRALADELLSYVKLKVVKTVADFCVGDGELLRAAQSLWKDAKYNGTDISETAVRRVRKTHSDWSLGKCDFLSESSRKKCKILQEETARFDLILLNPPFSCKGGYKHEILFEGKRYYVSTSVAFLAESIKFLSKEGCLYAILPAGVAYSEKDVKFWRMLERKYNLVIHKESTDKHFHGCSPSIVLVSIKAMSVGIINRTKKIPVNAKVQSIFRGKLQMYQVPQKINGKVFLIHSTNLRNNSIQNLNCRVHYTQSQISGPAVLIPRVGLPNSSKISVIGKKNTFVLSDCVIALKTKTEKESIDLKNNLIKHWDNLAQLYKGTGAKYITVQRLHRFLGLRK